MLLAVLLWPAASQGQDCMTAAASAEREQGFPTGVLQAIAIVESGRTNPSSGQTEPWPWAVDVAGQGRFFPDAASAIAAVMEWQASGVMSLDLGCLQVNLKHHPLAFATLADAFDPAHNAHYAGLFLARLFEEFGDWRRAIAAYHSRTPELGGLYADRVMAVWAAQRPAAPAGAAQDWAALPTVPIPSRTAALSAKAWAAPTLRSPEMTPPATALRLVDTVLECMDTVNAGRQCSSAPFASVKALRRALARQ